ncbi:unnamed protein product, partial [Owenia fusiformis]
MNILTKTRLLRTLSKSFVRRILRFYTHQKHPDIHTWMKMHMEISRRHMTPEMQLYLLTSRCALYNVPASSDESVDNTWNDPYWMFYWPGGQVLSRYILDNPKIFATKRVLDVGSGCGASAIAAAMMGARVVANDISKDAVEATKVNAALNNVSVDTSTKDFIGETDIDVDIVFLGDMFYDQEFTNIVYDWITHLSRNGTRILIGDPGRVHLL